MGTVDVVGEVQRFIAIGLRLGLGVLFQACLNCTETTAMFVKHTIAQFPCLVNGYTKMLVCVTYQQE